MWVPSVGQKIPWRRAWPPTSVFLPGESHRQRSQACYSPQSHKQSDTAEATQHAHMQELSMKTQKHISQCKFCLKPVAAAKGNMPQILQASLQQYVKQELREVHARFSRGSKTRDQIANIRYITEKPREFQKKKKIYFFTEYTKVFDCVDHNKLWKILKEIGIPDHLTCLLRNPCVGQ